MTRFCQGIIFAAIAAVAPSIQSPRASERNNGSTEDRFWIIFKDKSDDNPVAVSNRATERRLSRSSLDDFSWFDKPVNSIYLEDLERRGVNIVHASRWLNAASAILDSVQLGEVRGLSYVLGTAMVSSYSRPRDFGASGDSHAPPKFSGLNYGPSFAQNDLIKTDSLHNIGLSGEGILIGIMDTGFDTSHAAFSQMRVNGRIVATFDFINGDSDVVDAPDIQRTHGTEVLSVLGGYDPGFLIGPAYNSSYVLAKTELVYQEIQAEEDNWVAAAEWMESLGVDIISSSLGYIDWYDTTQLDGQTALITRAANTAVSLGVIVVNAAGNEAQTSWRKIIPPADGDSVIAAGAVNSAGVIASFSSLGPTADGRIKPDFCALGLSVYLANWGGGYGFGSGTSFATPLIAGGIALLLEGRQNWTIGDILTNMKAASSRRYLPNNTYGWGIPDFYAAYSGLPGPVGTDEAIVVAPHPAVDSAIFYLTATKRGFGELSIHDLSGNMVRKIAVASEGPDVLRISWDGKNERGEVAASGIYICVFEMFGNETRQKFFFIARP